MPLGGRKQLTLLAGVSSSLVPNAQCEEIGATNRDTQCNCNGTEPQSVADRFN